MGIAIHERETTMAAKKPKPGCKCPTCGRKVPVPATVSYRTVVHPENGDCYVRMKYVRIGKRWVSTNDYEYIR